MTVDVIKQIDEDWKDILGYLPRDYDLPIEEQKRHIKAALSVLQKMASGEEERERFEQWYSRGNLGCPSLKRDGGGAYDLMQTTAAWATWQACKADTAKHIKMLMEQEMK